MQLTALRAAADAERSLYPDSRLSSGERYPIAMSKALEHVSREAIKLPRQQRLALARFLIDLDEASAEEGVETAWDREISERARSVDEGHTEGIPYSDVLARIDRRLAP